MDQLNYLKSKYDVLDVTFAEKKAASPREVLVVSTIRLSWSFHHGTNVYIAAVEAHLPITEQWLTRQVSDSKTPQTESVKRCLRRANHVSMSQISQWHILPRGLCSCLRARARYSTPNAEFLPIVSSLQSTQTWSGNPGNSRNLSLERET